MLGEADLLRGPLAPGARMESMMAPTLVLDGDGLALAIGAAGGTRLRTALVTVAAGILDEGLEPQAAVDRPRVHPAGERRERRAGRRRGRRSPRSRRAGAPCGAGPSGTTTSAASARSAERGAAADPRRSGALELGGTVSGIQPT